MRGSFTGGASFSEHVSTYFNSVLETFTDYYPASGQNFLPKISSSFANQELPDNLWTIWSIVLTVLLVLYILKQVLHLDQMGEKPLVHMKAEEEEGGRADWTDGKVEKEQTGGQKEETTVSEIKRIMDKCTIFKSAYKPTWFWGKSGHIQTCLFGVMQKPHKAAADLSECKQYFVSLASDGALVSFHVYEPLKPHQSGEEVTLLVCPGIFGSYNKSYVQSTVGAACSRGYRIVCLDHLGVLEDVQLKTPRLFTYGSTEEYAAMCDKAFEMFPDSLFISIGYSMGGNQVCKYLGEKPDRQKKLITALSICQGYDCIRAAVGMTRWDKLQAVYSYILTQRWISLVEKHSVVVQAATDRGINWKDVRAARGLTQFDRIFSAKFYGYPSFEEFMRENSCSQHLDKIEHIPLLLINAIDDPLIGPFYHDIPLGVAKRKDNVAFVETHHGGHLGYFEKGMFYPREVWIDSAILEYCDEAVASHTDKMPVKEHRPCETTDKGSNSSIPTIDANFDCGGNSTYETAEMTALLT